VVILDHTRTLPVAPDRRQDRAIVEYERLAGRQAQLFRVRTTVNGLRTELARRLETIDLSTARLDEVVADAARRRRVRR